MIRPDLAQIGQELEIEVLGQRCKAVVLPESPYDPDNERLRS